MSLRVVHFRQAFSLLSETFIHDAVVEMERQGVDCRVVTLRREDERGRPFDKVTVVPMPARWHPARASSKVASLWRGEGPEDHAWPLVRRGLDGCLRGLRPDVIHAHFGPDALLVAPVAAALGIPLVATFYGYDFSMREVLDRWGGAYRSLFEQLACAIGVSRHACDRLVQLGARPSRVALVHLGIRAVDFVAGDPAARFDGRRVRCIHLGRLVSKKSPVELVEAFGMAVREVGADRDLGLTIVGDGPLMPDVRRKVAALGLADRVWLAGALPRADALRLLGCAHIYTQHSVTAPEGDQEGLPVSVVEAAATGLPVVSTLHSGIPEIVVDGQTGYLVAEHDVAAMGGRIVELARDPASWTRLGAAGRRRVEREFALDRETAKAIALLGRASGHHEPRPERLARVGAPAGARP